MSNTINKLKYRPDIDGLRAVAVLSVIIFHLNPHWLPGGFVGVDIFFVISGYLITSIIYQEVNEGRFSFQTFYTRRIKRIFPAFFVVVLFSLLVGFVVMLPLAFFDLGKTAFAALFFLSNVLFAHKGGYFDNPDTFPLLHTWSLSVEEQYYLIWPVILLVFFKMGFNYRKILVISSVLLILSFIFSQLLCTSDTFGSWGYYILPSRAGELLVGCILAFIHTENKDCKYTTLSSYLGIILIIFSLFLLNNKSVFPGINALYPSLGAACIIYGNRSSFINKLLSLKPVVYIGLLSYSLYLWHWPVLAFLRYGYPGELPLSLILIAVILITVLSLLSYYLVEKPVRSVKLTFPRAVKLASIPTIIIAVFCLSIFTFNGIPKRMGHGFENKYKNLFLVVGETTCSNKLQQGCTLVDNKGNSTLAPILVYGDSHAAQLEQFFKTISQKDPSLVFHFLTQDNCTFAKDIDEVTLKCKEGCIKNRALFAQELKNYNTVIIASRWESMFYPEDSYGTNQNYNYIEKFKSSLREITQKGKKVIILSQVPKYDIDVNKNEFVTKRLGFNVKYNTDPNYLKANEQLQKEIKDYENVYFLDLASLLCPNNTCTPYYENMMLYRNSDHLNLLGSQILTKRFLHSDKYELFKKIINNNAIQN